MMTWSTLMFPNANSPSMEQMIFFHDNSMTILIIITILISYMLINTMMNKMTNRLLLEGQNIEIIWTVLPAFMLIFIALPSLRLLYLMEENYLPSMTIKIIGHQWYWTYEYTDFNMTFDSFILPTVEMEKKNFRLLDVDTRTSMPYNTNIRLLISSADVIHAWSMPSLSLKMDAIPGRLNQLMTLPSRPGLYYGQCSEICGANHSFMPITLEITNINNFMTWIKNMS